MSFERAGAAELTLLEDIQRKRRTKSAVPEEDIGPPAPYPCGGPYLPELHGEVVQAVATKYVSPVRSKRFGKNAKPTFILWFKIISDGYEGVEAPCYFSMPAEGGRPSAASKYSRAWFIANEGPPLRGERMAYQRFLSSVFEVKLRLTKHARGGRKLAPENQYLVVDHIVALVAPGAKSR